MLLYEKLRNLKNLFLFLCMKVLTLQFNSFKDLYSFNTYTTDSMGDALSSRVKNMKFMQSADNKKRKDAKESSEKEQIKKIKDLSEWSLPVNGKTLKVIKAKNVKIQKVGYATINSIGPVNHVALGRKVMGNKEDEDASKHVLTAIAVKNKNEDQSYNNTNDDDIEDDEKSSKSKKLKKSKKSKKSKNVMKAFKTKNGSDDQDNSDGDDLTSKDLLNMWKKGN